MRAGPGEGKLLKAFQSWQEGHLKRALGGHSSAGERGTEPGSFAGLWTGEEGWFWRCEWDRDLRWVGDHGIGWTGQELVGGSEGLGRPRCSGRI